MRYTGLLSSAPAKFVVFDIVAQDAHGEPVRDLQPGDIRITDDEQAQQVVYCRADRGRPETPRPTVVVLDLSYAPVKSAAWNEVVRSLRQFETSAPLYFYVVTARGAMLPIHRLPETDVASSAAELPWLERALPPLESTLALEPLRGKSGMIGAADYTDLARHLAAFPGRHSLICVGCLLAALSDWEPNPNPVATARAGELRRLIDAFLAARVAVYPVGGKPVSGLIGGLQSSPVLLPGRIGAMANLTGGRTYTFGQIEEAIAQALRDADSTYRIAYLPGAANWDGKLHKITVKSVRGGVHLLAPDCYFAGRLEDSMPHGAAFPDIAVTSPYEQTDIGVSISTAKLPDVAARFEIRLDAGDLLLLHHNGRYSGSVTLELVCYMRDGRKRASGDPASIKLDLSEQDYPKAMHGGLRFPVEIPPGETPLKVRAVAHDEYSGAWGTATFVVSEDH